MRYSLIVLFSVVHFIGCARITDSELSRNQSILGVAIQDLMATEGLAEFDDLSHKVRPLDFVVKEEPVTIPRPKSLFRRAGYDLASDTTSVKVTDAGREIEAVCTRFDDRSIINIPEFESTQSNRRLPYSASNFYPYNVYIGSRIGGKLTPQLFFRDIGNHATSSHWMTIDKEGKCHLAVAEIFEESNNRFRLYWLIGNLKARKWENAFLVARNESFTYVAYPELIACDDCVHLFWDMQSKDSSSGIFHLQHSRDGFSRKLRIVSGKFDNFEIAFDQASGRIIVAAPAEEKGVLIVSRSPHGVWSRKNSLSPKIGEGVALKVQCTRDGSFLIRTESTSGDHEFSISGFSEGVPQ